MTFKQISSNKKTTETNATTFKTRSESYRINQFLKSKQQKIIVNKKSVSMACGQRLAAYNSVPRQLLKGSQKSEKI